MAHLSQGKVSITASDDGFTIGFGEDDTLLGSAGVFISLTVLFPPGSRARKLHQAVTIALVTVFKHFATEVPDDESGESQSPLN